MRVLISQGCPQDELLASGGEHYIHHLFYEGTKMNNFKPMSGVVKMAPPNDKTKKVV
jgi:hypothetical protein